MKPHALRQPRELAYRRPGQPVTSRGWSRREFGFAAAAGLGLAALGRAGASLSAAAVPGAVRLATGARTLDGCLGWLGAEANLFQAHGVRVEPAGAADPLAALLRGECDFAQIGASALARGVLEGRDPVLILSPVESHRAGALMTRADLRTPEQLAGARVAVPDESGVSAQSARMILRSFSVAATLVPVGTPTAAYAFLARAGVDAAYLPAELGFYGRRKFGWNMFQGGMLGVPGGLATTRRFIAEHRTTVAAVVRGHVDAIRLFKTRPDIVRPLLGRYLQIDDDGTLDDLQQLYAPLFRAAPHPTLFYALRSLREGLSMRYPGANRLETSDLVDATFVDELTQNAYIETLYSSGQTNERKAVH